MDSQSVDYSILAAYYAKKVDARKALWEMEKKGYIRTAVLHRPATGKVQVHDPFPAFRILLIILFAALFAVLAGLAFFLMRGQGFRPVEQYPVWAPFLAGGLAGLAFGLAAVRRSRNGIDRKVLAEHALWLLPEESVLLLQAPLHTFRHPQIVIRDSGETQPTVFLLHPRRKRESFEEPGVGGLLPQLQLQEYARRLAKDHRLQTRQIRNGALLKRITRVAKTIHQICRELSDASRLEQPTTPSAEWILDNEYIIESNVRDIQTNLPRSYFQELPVLNSDPFRNLPRIYGLAKELVTHVDLRLDQETIRAFLEAYQSVHPLTIGELWALPQMLRLALIDSIRNLAERTLSEMGERETAGFWANRLIAANRHDPGRLFSVLAKLTESQPAPSEYFCSQLISYLYDETNALVLVQNWLGRTLLKPLSDLNLREQNRQTKDQISIGNAFSSLRQLSLLDWRCIFEATSRVEQLLRLDPVGIYPQMDFDTRDRYRHALEEIARRSKTAESDVAERLLDLAAKGPQEDDRSHHVGYYLVAEGRRELIRLLRGRETIRYSLRRWVFEHHTAVFLLSFTSAFAVLFLPLLFLCLTGRGFGIRFVLPLLFILPVSQVAIEAMNYVLTRALPPRTLSKMAFEKPGIPDAFRTLVVVPILLTDAETVRAEADKLEIRYLGNKDAKVFFSLFSDYEDADSADRDGDSELLRSAVESINTLNLRYAEERFFLFHRGRRWSPSEQRYIGWERKRGKLEELNQFLTGTRPETDPPLIYAGNAECLSSIRFLITLDSDTQLPPGSARRMIGTLAHPLNRPRLDDHGRVIAGSYTILQPRVSPSLPSTLASPFSRLFADATGIDPYTKAVSDVYQDLTGQGSYNGKGIYDLLTFSRILTRRFPEERLLSHDLIEGEHVRTGLVSDIELFDEFPRTYLGYSERQHRWIRGDWQIIDWLFPRVPLAGGRSGPNMLSAFSRWKIFDNLRRSLVPIADLVLLAVSWSVSPAIGWAAALAVGLPFFFQPLTRLFSALTNRQSRKTFSGAQVSHDLLRGIVDAALLPHQAFLAADAILRVALTRGISHRGMLRWVSTQNFRRRVPNRIAAFVLSMIPLSAASGAAGWILLTGKPVVLAAAIPWLLLWFLSPLVGLILNVRFAPRPRRFSLSVADRGFLRTVARRTWRFFADCIGESTSWLPPDNFQVAYQNRAAMRTSPTNIGLGMTSTLAARDFGYIPADQVIRNLTRSMETIAKLERFEGHLLNWYDLRTLAPLEPRYVSTVDSGNLLAALYALDPGLTGLMRKPVLDESVFAGLADTIAILAQSCRQDKHSGKFVRALRQISRAMEKKPQRGIDALRLLRRTGKDIQSLAAKIRTEAGPSASSAAWALQLEAQVEAWIQTADRYLPWMEILTEKQGGALNGLGAGPLSSLEQALDQTPCLADLAEGKVPGLSALPSIRENLPNPDPSLLEWLDRLAQAFSVSKWLSGEMLGMGEKLVRDVRAICDAVDMRFLYDTDRRLFFIGYNLSEGRHDASHYDLLASEARLGSYIAIARGEVSPEHWFALGRLFREVDRQQVLISWTGTMFEYLMPLIFQKAYGNSLLERMTRKAVEIQIAFGRKNNVPWGFSESAFGDLDINKTYQYKAFGVPALALKRQSDAEIVVAPYASMLAVNISPQAAVRNLHHLAGLGLLSEYGYYDAIDFSQRSFRRGRQGIAIQTYMAHHQSMAFLSLANFLLGNPVQRDFHSNPPMRAAELLLQEKIPLSPPLYIISSRDRASVLPRVAESAPTEGRFDTPHTPRPRTQLLGHEGYSIMVTNSGGGFSRWNRNDVTRWRSDRTQDSLGTFCYVRDTSTGRIWSNTYHPVGGKVADDYSVHFALDRAVFRRKDEGIDTGTEIFVSAEDDVEIRRITLINRTVYARKLALTSYIELAMAPHNADLQHPAFQKLFIQTEAIPPLSTLLAFRRPRRPEEPPMYVAHRFTTTSPAGGPLQFETDRRRFIGRGRTLANPMGLAQPAGNSQGCVLDPILSLRENVVLEPGQRLQLSLIVAAGESREKVLSLAVKYGDPLAIERAMDFNWAAAQLELRSLRIQPDDARQFQKLANHLLYVNPLLRPSTERLEENRKGQAGLWPYGISGDLPIALVTIGESSDLGLIRQMLQAHSYWRKHGFWADLVILNEEAGGYERPLKEELDRLIHAYAIYSGIDQPGGIFLRHADQIPKEDLSLLKSAARVVLVAARGALPQQLGVHLDVPELSEPLAKKRALREPSAQLPFMELPYFNSLGGFTPDGREYAIYLAPGTNTPAPWINVLSNPNFGTLVSESGSGCTWFGNSQRNRLTGWSNDPVLDPPSEAVYIRDEETGAFWTPTASPIREETPYRARHGAGYTVFEHNSNGIEQVLTVLIPLDSGGGTPIKLQRLRLKNDTSRVRKLSINYFVEWTLGEHREATQMHIATRWDEESGALLARNRYHPEFGERVAFTSLNPSPEFYSGDRASFIGRNRSLSNPSAMERIRRSQRTGTGFDPCAALQINLELSPGEAKEITCMLGQADSTEQAREWIRRYRGEGSFEETLQQTRKAWDDLLGGVEIRTPELSADLMVNRWLLYQNLSCRIWGRSAFYQSGGAFGFRDQLQDCLAHLYTHPELTREHILRAASRQYLDGDVQHWWHPPGGAGVRTRISDDLLWLPFAAAQYVRVTGEEAILQTEIPFLSATKLDKNQLESFNQPETTLEQATLFEHCRRAVDRQLVFGQHGLPLMGTGDWDDGLNRVGAGGEGESVWLGWFLADVLEGMIELSARVSRPELAQKYKLTRNALIQQVEKAGWDGEWYLRAFFDDGTRLGSSESTEAKIFSLPQSWARISGAGDPQRTEKALDSAWKNLVRKDEALVLLFHPPFQDYKPFPGYIQAYPPGVRENGGQYTHAAIWLALAMAREGSGNRAVEILRMINPVERARDPETVWRFGLEPYATAADIYHGDGYSGRGGWSWYTGSAGWMYRVWVEEILGLKILGERMRIAPVIPGWWDGFQIRYRHGEAVYEIRVENPDHCEHGVAAVELDGQPLPDGEILLDRSLVMHKVLVRMGKE
ncbi:MAG: glucoamylase family protein [Anaerolineales bacterium]